ncbi:B12-binding domain-containing radical SAM protein [Chloroflexota bacterium]
MLINPLSKFVNKDIMPPLGLAWLAVALEQNSISVEILDALVERKDLETVSNDVKKTCPDIVGITCVTATRSDAFKMADKIRGTYSSTTIVMGGPHVTFTAEDTLQNIQSVDIIVRGEGEVTFVELVKALESGKDLTQVKGISFRSGENIIHNPSRPFIEDLDSLPFPARHLLPMEKYDFTIPFSNVKATNVMSGRGCPIGCIYCSTSAMWGKKIRVRSPSHVVDEIEQIVKEYGIKGIYFFDDTFTFHKRRTTEICDEIIQRGLDLTWFCESRVDDVDEELLTKMKKAGCKIITFGIESGSQRVLDIIKKKTTIAQSINAINLCKKVGIKSKSFFIYGVPGELLQDMEATIRLVYGLNSDVKIPGMCEIRPGTELEFTAKELNIMPDGFSWAKEGDLVPKFGQQEPLDKQRAMIQRKVWREHLFNPTYVLKRLIELNIKILPRLRQIVSAYISIITRRD